MTTKPHNNGRSEIFDATCDNVSVGAVSTQISLGISRSTLKPTEPRYRCFSRRIMRSNMEIKVYGMIEAFDSHNGIERFIEKELISRLLPNDRTGVHVLDKNPSDGQIISLLNETFQNIDHEYFRRFIGSPLAERCSQLMYPGASLEPMNDKVDGGATAMVVLIHGNRLFTANLGDSRAIMVQKKKGSDALTATQITTWHDPKDPEERDRLIRLEIKPSDVIAPTRCFGDVFRKEGALSCAIIAEPSVHGPIVIGKAARFLILVNAETVTLLNDLNKNENVNRTIASIFADKLMETNCDLEEVAQDVLDHAHNEHLAKCASAKARNSVVRRGMLAMLIVFNMCQSSVASETTANIDDDSTVLNATAIEIPLDGNGRIKPYVDLTGCYTNPKWPNVLRNLGFIIEECWKKSRIFPMNQA